LSASDALGKQFHGTDAVLQPGDRILPRSVTGRPINAATWRDTSQNVSTTAHLPLAAKYGNNIYVVQPVGVLGRDPEYGGAGPASRGHPQGRETYDAQEAVVVRRVSDTAAERARNFRALPRSEGRPVTQQRDLWGFGNEERRRAADRARRKRAR